MGKFTLCDSQTRVWTNTSKRRPSTTKTFPSCPLFRKGRQMKQNLLYSTQKKGQCLLSTTKLLIPSLWRALWRKQKPDQVFSGKQRRDTIIAYSHKLLLNLFWVTQEGFSRVTQCTLIRVVVAVLYCLKESKNIQTYILFCCIEIQWSLLLAFLVEETEADQLWCWLLTQSLNHIRILSWANSNFSPYTYLGPEKLYSSYQTKVTKKVYWERRGKTVSVLIWVCWQP